MEKIDFTLVLALYNEGPILKNSLQEIFNILDNNGLTYEIILIDDKSQDQTAENAKIAISKRDNCYFFQHDENVGRGGTVAEGMRKARGEVVGFIDVDLEVSPIYMPRFVKIILSNEVDVVCGHRLYKLHWSSIFRHLAGRSYHLMVKWFLGLPLKDTETGYKFFSREKILPVLERTKDKDWFFDTEIMARAYWAGLKIEEPPVLFIKRPDKKSTVNFFKDSWDYLVKLWYFKRRTRTKKNENN